jgi:hypothetical protein
MGFRFQRRLKLFPGVTLNVSKSGLSTSFGVRGARVTVGHGKTRTTVGLPGTGLSYTSVESSGHTSNSPAGEQSSGIGFGQLLLLGLTFLAWFLWLADQSGGWVMLVYIALAIACGLTARMRGRSAINWMCVATYATPILGFAALLSLRNPSVAEPPVDGPI